MKHSPGEVINVRRHWSAYLPSSDRPQHFFFLVTSSFSFFSHFFFLQFVDKISFILSHLILLSSNSFHLRHSKICIYRIYYNIIGNIPLLMKEAVQHESKINCDISVNKLVETNQTTKILYKLKIRK